MNGASTLSSFGGFSSAITGVGEIYAAIPRVSQGTDDHNRIGNQISPMSCTIKFDIACKTYNDNAARDRTVHIFLLTAKSVKSLDNYTSIPITTLLDKGDGTSVSFDGTQPTAQYPVNTKEFTVLKHKAVRMVQGYGIANSLTAPNVGTTDGVITPSHQYARYSMRVKIPKTFKYERASQQYPTNSAPFVVIGFTHNNSNTTAPTDFVQVLAQTQMRYKDE